MRPPTDSMPPPTDSMPPSLLSIDSLGVSLGGVSLLRSVSLEVRRGEILGLVGASGSGKSLTALAVLGLLPPGAAVTGTIRLRDTVLTALSEPGYRGVRGRDVGMVFQEPMTALNPLMRIGDQVSETVRLHGRASRAGANTLTREALTSVGLDGVAGAPDRYPHELSGGQRQRVALAMAIVLRPALLIADEPTTALDVRTQAQVLMLLRDLVQRHGMGLVLVSHDLAVIAQIADRVAVMQAGAVVEVARSGALRALHHPYARALLAAAEPAPKPLAAGLPPEDPLLEVQGLVREYRGRRRSLGRAAPAFRAVDEVTLTVHAGETVGLVGESGSGKSTLLRAVLGLDAPQAGTVRLNGEGFSTARGAGLRRLRRRVQAVFQDPYGSFDPLWTVERLIAEPYHLLDTPPDAAGRRRRLVQVIEQVGLAASDLRKLPHEFSGGERQRIAIARALVTEPALIAFDEAVSALDVLVRGQILELLADLSRRLRLSYLFVSHDLNVIRAIADRVYVMQQGRIVEQGPTEQVFTDPQHAYTRELLSATPRIGNT